MNRGIALVVWMASPVAALAGAGPAAELVGLWGCERLFGPEIRGQLVVARDQPGWLATIAGLGVAVSVEGQTLMFSLPGEHGSFRGRLDAAGRIVGHWIQPRTLTSGVRYATPVVLAPTEDGIWRGEVSPLDDRLSLYLVVQQTEDGTVTAFLRNPERNIGMFYQFGAILRDSSRVRLTDRSGGQELLAGAYDASSEVLSIFFPSYAATFDFTRRGRDQAVGFYPRTPAGQRYDYRPPPRDDDGWDVAAMDAVGLDHAPIRALIEAILATEATSVTAPYVQAVLIARHGKLVVEEYFYGFHRERPHDTRSAGKSLASTLTGIAIDRGAEFTAASRVYPLFAGYSELDNPDPRKAVISVRHLLTMGAGYDCDDNDSESAGNEDRMYQQTAQPDWYRYALELPMARAPGERGVYCTAAVNLLGGLITGATGRWIPDFFYQRFASPLQIERYHMNLMPEGNGYLGGGIFLRPRDLLKLGQLYLDGGVWNGRRIVSQGWVEEATRPHSSINVENDYGYNWWRQSYELGDAVYEAYYASGNGGQLLIVVPALELVVLFMGGNYANYPTWARFRDQLVPEYVLPAASNLASRIMGSDPISQE